mmetsp:Transcript_96568/g.272988  ORF Transcript_96568/g.272988 Transcript_96568/m.272988 type:complete len:430 (-) Transcript_96568:238-1527(-)
MKPTSQQHRPSQGCMWRCQQNHHFSEPTIGSGASTASAVGVAVLWLGTVLLLSPVVVASALVFSSLTFPAVSLLALAAVGFSIAGGGVSVAGGDASFTGGDAFTLALSPASAFSTSSWSGKLFIFEQVSVEASQDNAASQQHFSPHLCMPSCQQLHQLSDPWIVSEDSVTKGTCGLEVWIKVAATSSTFGASLGDPASSALPLSVAISALASMSVGADASDPSTLRSSVVSSVDLSAFDSLAFASSPLVSSAFDSVAVVSSPLDSSAFDFLAVVISALGSSVLGSSALGSSALGSAVDASFDSFVTVSLAVVSLALGSASSTFDSFASGAPTSGSFSSTFVHCSDLKSKVKPASQQQAVVLLNQLVPLPHECMWAFHEHGHHQSSEPFIGVIVLLCLPHNSWLALPFTGSSCLVFAAARNVSAAIGSPL